MPPTLPLHEIPFYLLLDYNLLALNANSANNTQIKIASVICKDDLYNSQMYWSVKFSERFLCFWGKLYVFQVIFSTINTGSRRNIESSFYKIILKIIILYTKKKTTILNLYRKTNRNNFELSLVVLEYYYTYTKEHLF